VAAVCEQFQMGLSELEAMLGPEGLQDALEQVMLLQDAEQASVPASSSAAVPPPPPPAPRPLSAAPAAAAAQHVEPPRPLSAASQASSSGLPAQAGGSAAGMRVVNSEGAWVCHCGARNNSKRPRCKSDRCKQLAPCRKWMLGTCAAAGCQYPHPPFDPAGDWRPPKDGKPKAVLWEGAPLVGAPQPAAAAPPPPAAAPQPPAEDDGDLDALLQNLGISDSSASGWGEDAQGAGATLPPPAAADSLSAMATPGLRNEAGEYNCFLNAIIQCLWRCADFRQQVGARGRRSLGRLCCS
jgi:hypothetical protein